MRAKAYLQSVVVWGLVLMGCNTQSPCETMGGRCTRPDVDCGPTLVFTGYDAECEPNSKCCVPRGTQPVDAGTNACAQGGGKCQTEDLPCAAGTVRSNLSGCTAGNQCCAPSPNACKPKGRCATQCNTNEAIGLNAPDCPGMACCTPR